MKFEPRTPDESVNVSSQKPLAEATQLVLGVSAVAVIAVVVVAKSVDVLAPRIPPEVEQRVFASLALDFASQVEDDPLQAERITLAQRLVDRLHAHWPEAPMRYQVGLLASDDANAAAFPGGWILVTDGLLSEARTENELAFVLAHELGHFRNRDHLRRLGRGVVYGLAIATLVRSGGPGLDLATLAGDLTSRGFDREQETAADLFGLELVHAEYGHVASAGDFFARRDGEEGDPSGLAIYLSTHPGSHDRAGELLTYARQHGWPVEGTPIEIDRQD